MVIGKRTQRKRRTDRARKRNTKNKSIFRSRTAPRDMPIGGALLAGEPSSFFRFLTDEAYRPLQRMLFEEQDTVAGMMLAELRLAVDRYYFGVPGTVGGNPVSPGKLRRSNTRARRSLRQYVRRAYRGDRRGIAFWDRVARLLWDTHESVLRLRRLAEKIERLERQRGQRTIEARTRRARYMRNYRKRRAASSRLNQSKGED